MLFYECAFLGSALLTATSVFSLVHIETKHARSLMSNPTFTNESVIEVMKNISRVNNALQELIKNYEQLQKIYKTHSFESSDDYSTDSEVDERYRYNKKNNGKVATDIPLNGFPGTQAFKESVEYSAIDDDNLEESKSEGSNSDAANHNRLPAIEKLQAQSSPFKNEIRSESTESSVSGEVVFKEPVPMHTTSTKKPPQIIFLDSHKILTNISRSALRPQASANPKHDEHYSTPKPNTRYKKIDHRSDLRSGFLNDMSLSINFNGMPKTNGSRKVFPMESFPRESMWDEISTNEPFTIQGDAYFRTQTKKESDVIGSIAKSEYSPLRNGPKAPESPNFIKAPRAENQLTENKNSEYESESDSAAEEKEMNKEIFKTHVLRQAYGDSCTKLVVRNCFKACKAAVKRSCGGSACKGGFKMAFENHSKASCIHQFDPSKSQARTNPISGLSRTGGINFPNDDYLTTACWPLLKTEKSATIHRSKMNSTSLDPEEELIVLRNRYEKACQSTMAEKCSKACMHSFEAACKSSVCPRKRESQFRRNCKSQCRDVFKRKSYKDSDSDSDSGSGSSGSDSSSSVSDSDSD